ncbi:MAG: hypothetical protein AB1813_02710 [Verrucomicrobiota bacterium]
MSLLLKVCHRWACLGLTVGALGSAGLAQNVYQPAGHQYLISGTLPGDQIHPHLAINSSGGYLVWQDNSTDGDGFGIRAIKLSRNFNGTLGAFRVNQQGAADQERPQVALLKNGGAAFVWQTSNTKTRKVYARFLGSNGTFVTGDILVPTYTEGHQMRPVVTGLSDGSAVVIWSSFGQDGSLDGIYGQRFSGDGGKIGTEFQVNQSTLYNQRDATVAGLANGNFVVGWVGESGSDISGVFNVNIWSRLFNANGPIAGEFKVNSGTNICATPSVSGSADGGFVLTWGEADANRENGWDVHSRAFGAEGTPKNVGPEINTRIFGDQFSPRIAGGEDQLVVWSSMGHDGSFEGVFGRFLTGNGDFLSDEFQVNSVSFSRQVNPAVAHDGSGNYVIVWSSFFGGMGSFDLVAQRISKLDNLPAPSAPILASLSQNSVSASWPEITGMSVSHYELFVDGETVPIITTNNFYVVTRESWTAKSTHSIRLAFKLTDGRRSGMSDAATVTTWGGDDNADQLPDDWQTFYWGRPVNWPASSADSDGDGASTLQEFLAGTDPTNPQSVLKTALSQTPQGRFLIWNTQAGLVYQVQTSSDLSNWSDVSTPRFATGDSDSMPVAVGGAAAYFRVNRLR